jgi:hypothetical protein
LTSEQKVKFKGESNQIYHIGRKAFPPNVWIVVSPGELEHLVQTNVRQLFVFEPPIDFSLLADEPVEEKKSRRRAKKKETEEVQEE